MKLPKVLTALRNALLTATLFIFAENAFAWDNLEVGMTIAFGRYPQTESSEVKPIEWWVLDVKDNKALLLSWKGLDSVPYNTEYKAVTWKTSSIRQWLNTDFYNTAFNDSEKSRIAITVLDNPDNHNPLKMNADTPGGGDTRDRIFLLSYVEAAQYLPGDHARMLEATPYAVKRGVHLHEHRPLQSSYWWLRSPGRSASSATFVYSHGLMSYIGDNVDYGHYAVRPALWVNL
ncbi:MAG: hypothetical protein II922_01320 [Succinimonas sp.]|nr:hypothetical protein [Succinimonas sp.]